MVEGLKVRFWGVRGSISCPGAEYVRYGGNTSCLEITAGGRRLIQRAKGYRHTFVSGTETFRDGKSTGAKPGKLIRGTQQAPSLAAAAE